MKRYGLVGGALAFASILGVQTITLAAPPDAGPRHFQRFDRGGRGQAWRNPRMGAEPRARLGIVPIAISPALRTQLGAPADRGVLVDQVLADGAAAKAGLKVGDVLTVVAGRPVTTRAEVLAALGGIGAQTFVNLMVVRNGTPLPLVATLPKPSDEAAAGDEGPGDDDQFDFDFDFGFGPGDDEADEAGGAFPRGPMHLRPGRFPFDISVNPERLEALEKRLEALEKRLRTHASP